MPHEPPPELLQAACDVRKNAHAVYSRFQVGAALRSVDGRIFVGCNVENVSYGLTNCAERTAVFAAVAAGVKQFDALAIATTGGIAPCGACRQVLAEFCDDLPIWLVDVERPEHVKTTSLRRLLPDRFDHFEPGSLLKK